MVDTRLLSVLIPAYNERYTIREILRRVRAAPLPEGLNKEVIVVDDGSRDGTWEVLQRSANDYRGVRLLRQDRNRGKGAAISRALKEAKGGIILFQDADLEYDPRDYPRLLAPILDGDADVVYGSRFLPADRRRVLFFRHAVGNKLLTLISNILTDLNLTDMETGFKVFRASAIKTIPIRSQRFGIEPELAAKIAKRGLRLYEVPISYHGRTYAEGKKITWRDGVKALFVIFKYWLVDDSYTGPEDSDILEALSRSPHLNRWIADQVRPFVGDRVLEVGAGIGSMTSELLPRDEYLSSDITQDRLDILRDRFDGRPCTSVQKVDITDADDWLAHSERYDSVVCLNVLEHIDHRADALRNMASAVRPGGNVLIIVPRGSSLFGSLDEAVGHRLRYDTATLASEAAEAGLEVTKCWHFNKVGVLGWFLNAKVLRRRRFSRFQLRIYDVTVWLWRGLDAILPWPGLSLVAVLRKPRKPI